MQIGRPAETCICFFFSSRRRHTRLQGDWSSDVCSSDLPSEALRLLVANRQTIADPAAQRRAVGGAVVVWLICLPLAAAAAAVVAWYAPAITGAGPGLRTTVPIAAALVLAGGVLRGLLSLPDAALHGMHLGYQRLELQARGGVRGGGRAAPAR